MPGSFSATEKWIKSRLEGIMVFRNPVVGYGKHILSGTFVGFVLFQHAMEKQRAATRSDNRTTRNIIDP
jgi:hypothetical protein